MQIAKRIFKCGNPKYNIRTETQQINSATKTEIINLFEFIDYTEPNVGLKLCTFVLEL